MLELFLLMVIVTFIEKIAGQFAKSHASQGDLCSQYFEVQDRSVTAQSGDYYLLAAAYHLPQMLWLRSN